MAGELADGALPALDRGERLCALRREPVRNDAGRAIFGELARSLERGRRGHDHAQHRRQRREIIIGGPFAQTPQRCGDRGDVDPSCERAKAAVRDLIGRQPVGFPRDPEQLARAERGDDDRTGLDRHPVGHAIIERSERGIQGDDTGALHFHSRPSLRGARRRRNPAMATEWKPRPFGARNDGEEAR